MRQPASNGVQSQPSLSDNGYQGPTLPKKKRSRHKLVLDEGEERTQQGNSTSVYLEYKLPDEVMLKIFSYLDDSDLCRVAQVCRRFHTVSNDSNLWRHVFQSVFEYSRPLFRTENGYEFCEDKPAGQAASWGANSPWKESCRALRHGVHVWPNVGSSAPNRRVKNVVIHPTIEAALRACEPPPESTATATDKPPLIILHKGVYSNEQLVISSNVHIIGAAPGEPTAISEAVVIERDAEYTMLFVEGAKDAYVGYVTLKFTADSSNGANGSGLPNAHNPRHYCVEISGPNCSPTIQRCIIRSSSVGESISSIIV
jgi:F-box protein 11